MTEPKSRSNASTMIKIGRKETSYFKRSSLIRACEIRYRTVRALHACMALSVFALAAKRCKSCSPRVHGPVLGTTCHATALKLLSMRAWHCLPDAPIFEIGEAALHAYIILFLKDKHHVTLNCFGFAAHQLGKPGRLEPQSGFRESNAWICAGTPSLMKIPPSMVFVSRSIPGALRHPPFR